MDGLHRVADHYDNMWDGDLAGRSILLFPIDTTQYGTRIDRTIYAWTGTDYYGVAGGYGGPLGSTGPSAGIPGSTNGR